MSPKNTPAEPVEAQTELVAPVKPGGKGRPTPKRSESVKKRTAVVAPTTRKEALALQREKRREETRNFREGMKSGDVSRLPARERAPEKVLARDVVDSRRNIAVLTLPVLIPLYVISAALKDNKSLALVLSTLMLTGMFAVVIDCLRLRREVLRAVESRLPAVGTRGLGFYAIQRAAMFRKLRQPAPRVKVGDPLPK